MEISVEYHPGEVQVIVRGPEDSEELLRILSLLRGEQDKLWGWDEHRTMVAISPQQIIWAEMVENKVFVYTEKAMYQTFFGLSDLEGRWEEMGFFRCANSVVNNLNPVTSLRSCPGGRIEARMVTGEKVVVSRRYAPLLRARIQEGG